MPEIARFYGIIIKLFFGDHPPPHFHAVYGEYNAVFNIETLEMIEGDLPPRAVKMILEWGTQYQQTLLEMWNTQDFRKLPPLNNCMQYPKIKSAWTIDERTLIVEFSNNEKRKYDITKLLTKEMFYPLQNFQVFKNFQIDSNGYAIVWNEDIDISEYEILTHGVIVN